MRADPKKIDGFSPSVGLSNAAPGRRSRHAGSAGGWITLTLAAALCFAHLACGKSKKLGPGSTTPNPVTNFQAEVLGSDTVRLTWSAPSGDSPTGRATGYDVRQSAIAITDSTFSSADTVGTPPTPAQPGASQQCYATEIPGSATRYFAIRASNKAGEWSPLVPVGPVQTAADTIPPGRVTDLSIVSTTDTEVALSWTAPGDDGSRGRASGIEVRYLGGILNDYSWASAHLAGSHQSATNNAGTRRSMVVDGIPLRVRIQLAVRVYDEANGASPVSNTVIVALRGTARDWIVQQDGAGDTQAIQAAIDSAMRGDVVLVGDGTYYECVSYRGKAISLVSKHGPARTTIDADHNGSVISFSAGEGRDSILEGFTITHGSGTIPPLGGGRVGGGIFCSQASPTIRNNIITDCRIDDRNGLGGGVYLGDTEGPMANALLVDNLVRRCTSRNNGGGVAIWGSSAQIQNNVFEADSCSFDGGGIFGFSQRGQIVISGNTFTANRAGDHGGGVHLLNFGRRSEPSQIERNIFYLNSAFGLDNPENRNGVGGGVSLTATTGSVAHNTFWGNSGEAPGYPGGGGILLYATTAALSVYKNVICASHGGGVVLLSDATGESLEENLFWDNSAGNWNDELCAGCDTVGIDVRNVIADPLFCGAETGDFRLQSTSPARTSSGVCGALEEACSPQAPLLWSQIASSPARLHLFGTRHR